MSLLIIKYKLSIINYLLRLADGYVSRSIIADDSEFVLRQVDRDLALNGKHFYDIISKIGSTAVVQSNSKSSTHCIYENPAAWIFHYKCGAIGALKTMPEHRRKGLAKYVMQKQIEADFDAEMGVFSYPEVDNEVSMLLHQKLGFVNTYKMDVVYFLKPETKI